MEKAVVHYFLLGLLLAFVSTLPDKEDWDIYNFHINSTVTDRYATTVITSRVVNRIDQAREIEFHVRIPKNAFISQFKMLIDGQMYDGVVKAKEQAQQQYTEAVSRGESAGLVSSVGRTLEEFKTSVTVAAHKKVTFELTYEELLKRRHGEYELQIYARPMQPVTDFKIDVYIREKPGINFIKVKGGLSTLANAISKTHAQDQAWVHFYPTVKQQINCDNCGEQGMNGDLVIVYDVTRESSLGDIMESDGYFVHHFAPSHLPRIPKNVVFVIDQSGSMHGRKIQQTRVALVHILEDLAEEDYFGLITFNSRISPWKTELVQANENMINAAKDFAQRIREQGSTNINAAVLEGARMLNVNPRSGSASLLILLTDGDPTTGVTNLESIQSNVREAINKRFPLYCLGFGHDVNFKFLEKMSLENNGAARRIYDDSDADLQLKGFYEEVATPLLTDVTMIYGGATNLTQTNFSQYYNGSEIVVAGKITDNNIESFVPQVVAISRNAKVQFTEKNGSSISTETLTDNINRVWAYLTVKQLLEKELQLDGDEKQRATKDALELSLKYSFVTPLTSMVVTKPPGEDAQVLHKPREGTNLPPDLSHSVISRRRIAFSGSSGRQSRLLASPQMYERNRQGKGLSFQSRHLYDVQMEPSTGSAPPGPPGPPEMYQRNLPDARLHSPMLFSPQVVKIPNHDSTIPLATHSVYRGADGLPTEASEKTRAPDIQRFVLRVENQTLPLCYDLDSSVSLKLLHNPNAELYVNGQLSSFPDGGFERIVIHVKKGQHIEINVNNITVRDGQNISEITWEQNVIVIQSTTLILRDKEADLTIGDMRLVVLLHERHGRHFLWPVLRQHPSGSNLEGLLVLNPVTYEEIPQTRSPKLKIRGRRLTVFRTTVVDYSIPSAPTFDCWLLSAESALGRPLRDFRVTSVEMNQMYDLMHG